MEYFTLDNVYYACFFFMLIFFLLGNKICPDEHERKMLEKAKDDIEGER